MPLSEPAPRALSHTRRLELKAYEREDGLWDIEGHITDHKEEDYDMLDSFRTADQPMHDMWLRLTTDTDLVVHAAEAVMDAGAHGPCHLIAPNYDCLVGLKIGPGWNRAVRERLGGVKGCTHLNEMLAQMATTAMQSVFEAAGQVVEKPDGSRYLSPGLHNSCYAYALNSPYIRDCFPDYYEAD
ncbi:MAG: DUF2889 domain-containing protein [Rhodospirillaceae bacterium]|jgi:hypothetical protein|nr:DUF2889 domain-containing protein [Rhodospirillaceae bacterium]MBT5194906.1 DUF2889 domain-containing protein [Rhodospirillaceae bacterium]MBT5895553.1 DUF2889 domain-containing protein [Rhodospirillaceae bacterium]MBT6429480.1 DUF2889 domain-containing protein [Rhodospirillaceae bacterium]MBT7757232.1 DUF2889 domain-containing protein [Rhodospirillaceae bacterium]